MKSMTYEKRVSETFAGATIGRHHRHKKGDFGPLSLLCTHLSSVTLFRAVRVLH
jgi:hypothetical protein